MPTPAPWAEAFTAVGWTLPAPLAGTPDADATAVKHLEAYFAVRPNGAPMYSGSRFETLGGRGDAPDLRDAITAADLVALTTLSINISNHVDEAIALLQPGARPAQPTHTISSRDVPVTELPFDTRRIYELLRLLPTDLSLEDATDEHMVLADELFWQLRRKDFGPVAVYKLRARKRPHLLPICDDFVRRELGMRDFVGFERNLRTVLRHEDKALARHLADIKTQVPAAAHLSTLRVFDIIVWREHQQNPQH